MRDPGPTNFLESNALLFAQAAQWTEMHDVLDEMSPNELRSLYHAADRLRLTIWDRLSRPNDMGRNGPVPDPRKHRTYNVVPLPADPDDEDLADLAFDAAVREHGDEMNPRLPGGTR